MEGGVVLDPPPKLWFSWLSSASSFIVAPRIAAPALVGDMAVSAGRVVACVGAGRDGWACPWVVAKGGGVPDTPPKFPFS